MIMPSADNPVTVHLAEGTYSPESGEAFPIILPSYTNLEVPPGLALHLVTENAL